MSSDEKNTVGTIDALESHITLVQLEIQRENEEQEFWNDEPRRKNPLKKNTGQNYQNTPFYNLGN